MAKHDNIKEFNKTNEKNILDFIENNVKSLKSKKTILSAKIIRSL
jgi:hypothetical protein